MIPSSLILYKIILEQVTGLNPELSYILGSNPDCTCLRLRILRTFVIEGHEGYRLRTARGDGDRGVERQCYTGQVNVEYMTSV